MLPRRWLIKFAPFRTSWSEIVARGTFTPRGIRSAQARKHLAEMRRGDSVLFYQSQQQQAIVGEMEVIREAYPDPTSADPQWITCDFVPIKSLSSPVTLQEIRRQPTLSALSLLKQPRLSVMPVTEAENQTINTISEL